jgi:multiple RNA-binding domain-containing protein 1
MDILKGSKIVVRNLAFEADKKELNQLFKPYGEIKAIRIPKKMDG